MPFPPAAERFERLEETLQIAHQMWDGDEGPYAGKHYHLERPLNVPQALRRPRPPILVGGGGELKTLRLVAAYADACNIFYRGLGLEGVSRKYDILRGHCEAVGRDYAEIDKSVLLRVTLSQDGTGTAPSGEPMLSVDEAVDRIGSLGAIGTDTVILGMANDADDAAYRLVAEVVRQVGPLTPAGR